MVGEGVASRAVLVDHWTLMEPGGDRGLGRYASQVMAAAHSLESWDVIALSRQHPLTSPDSGLIYHAMSPERLPLRKRLPWVCSVLDTIPLDVSAYRRFGIKTRFHFENARRSDIVLALSEHTADRVVSVLRLPASRVRVASLFPAEDFRAPVPCESVDRFIEESTGSEPFVCALVDGRTPDVRKRFHWIDEVAERLLKSGLRFIVTGRGVHPNAYPHCAVVPALSDAELGYLYSRAVAHFYPSAYEGQGMPPLEAMAAGCPVIAFQNTSVTEVVGDGGYLLSDPAPWRRATFLETLDDRVLEEIRETAVALAEDSRLLEERRYAARQSSARYTPQRLAEQLDLAYGAAISEGSIR